MLNVNALGIDEDYYYELVELINSTEDCLLELEKGYDDSVVNSINRWFHSLKGNCGMLGLFELETLFHKGESSFLEQSKLKQIEIDKFLFLVDKAKEYFEQPSELIIKEALTNLTKQQASKTQAQKDDHLSAHLNVFHLDDEPDILDVIAMQLDEYDCKVTSFSSPTTMREAILAGHFPDLFIIDFNMPEQNGNAVINALNSILPKIPKVLLSGFVDKEVLFESLNRGVIGVLEKPVDTFYLEKILKKARDIKKQNRINSQMFNLCMEYDSLSQKQVQSKLELIKKTLKEPS